MKKITALALCLLMIMQITCFASTTAEYGEPLKKLRMWGVFPSEEFWSMYSGREACSYSDEQAYKGQTSLRVDVKKLGEGARRNLNFESQKVYPKNLGVGETALCYEWYIYGLEEDVFAGRVTFTGALTDSNGNTTAYRTVTCEKTEKDGWIRAYMVIPASAVKNAEYCTMGLFYNLDRGDITPGDYFYVDELAIRVVPAELYINDVVAKSYVNTDSLRVFGINDKGEKKLINTKENMRFSVLSGDAMINGNSITYTGKEGGYVTVKCEFFGISTEFDIYFNPQVQYSGITENADGSVAVTVYNNGNSDAETVMVFALYDATRLYTTQVVNTNIAAGGEKEIVCNPIRVSENIKEPVVMIYAWDSFGGMCVLK